MALKPRKDITRSSGNSDPNKRLGSKTLNTNIMSIKFAISIYTTGGLYLYISMTKVKDNTTFE